MGQNIKNIHKKQTTKAARPIAIDLFCGCGAMTEGFKRAGFKIIAAVDNDIGACATYQKNHPEVFLKQEDIRLVDPASLLNSNIKTIDAIIVCAPCQPFSPQNKNKKDDKRADLVLEVIRFAEKLNPALIIFENVFGLVTGPGQTIIDKLKSDLSRLGYKLGDPHAVDAADFSVPQRRRRCIMFASKTGKIPELSQPMTPKSNRKTVKEAINDLQSLASGQKSPGDRLHFARNHAELALLRMQHIPEDGGSRFSLPSELELACHKGKKAYPDVYGRMKWDDVAPTLTTGCTDITRGRFMHPRDNRAITLREAARLQTFPDDYEFTGSPSEIATQIGNAVPVLLAETIGLAAIKDLSGQKKGKH